MISVCIATYNGEKYIRTQVDSILKQIGVEDEIVVSDNLSTDDTINILRSYSDSRIRIYHFPNQSKIPHEAVSYNFENALKRCSGEYIFLSDQDDIWYDNKVERMMVEFKKGYDVVVSSFDLLKDGKIEKSIYEHTSPIGNWLIKKPKYFGCCMAFNRKILDVSLPFPCHLPLHDGWIGILGELTGKVSFISEPLIHYRVYHSSTSHSTKNKRIYSLCYRLRMYIQFICRFCSFKVRSIKLKTKD